MNGKLVVKTGLITAAVIVALAYYSSPGGGPFPKTYFNKFSPD
jgi:hypothetical protein